MNTIREIDYCPRGGEIVERIERAEEAVEIRRKHLRDWRTSEGRTEESREIEYIEDLLCWLKFGGTVPSWIVMEESLGKNERLEEPCNVLC